jgi:sugar-phosphatase
MRFECDAILFDLDGVLIDSSACIERHWRVWASEHGLDLAAIMAEAHGKRTIETMRLIAPELDCEREAERFTALELADTEGVLIVDGASRLLNVLPLDAWAIVTSAGTDLALARLKQAGLSIPLVLVGADDVKAGKPAPEAYLVGAARMGIPPERCVVVEDSPSGIQAGRRAGMRVIAVATTHAKLSLTGGDTVLDSLVDLRISRRFSGGARLGIEIAGR